MRQITDMDMNKKRVEQLDLFEYEDLEKVDEKELEMYLADMGVDAYDWYEELLNNR